MRPLPRILHIRRSFDKPILSQSIRIRDFAWEVEDRPGIFPSENKLAIDVLENLCKKDVDEKNELRLSIRILLARLYRKEKQYLKSEHWCDKASELCHDNPNILYEKGVLYFNQGKYSQAKQLFFQKYLLETYDISAMVYQTLCIFKQPGCSLSIAERSFKDALGKLDKEEEKIRERTRKYGHWGQYNKYDFSDRLPIIRNKGFLHFGFALYCGEKGYKEKSLENLLKGYFWYHKANSIFPNTGGEQVPHFSDAHKYLSWPDSPFTKDILATYPEIASLMNAPELSIIPKKSLWK